MKYKFLTFFVLLFFSITCFGQGERKLSKNFSFAFTKKLDTVWTFTITQRVKRSGWGEFYGSFTQALLMEGFTVMQENKHFAHSYDIIVDYTRGFSAGKMQYSDLSGQIINKNSEIVGTFSYKGRFNPDEISTAIASKLQKADIVIVKFEQQ